MTIYNPELNPYSSLDDYTFDGLYSPIVNVEKQVEDTKPKKVTTDIKLKKAIIQPEGTKNALDSKNVVIPTEEAAVVTSVDSKEAAEARMKLDETKPEPVSAKKEIKAEEPNEGVEEPPKRKRGRPRKVQIDTPKDTE